MKRVADQDITGKPAFMKWIPGFLFNFLSKPLTTWLITGVCIAAKSRLIFHYSFIGWDKIQNINAAHNLLNGHGINIEKFYTSHINQPVVEPFCMWPPGFALFFSPFLKLFRSNYWQAVTIFDILFFIFFLLVSRALFRVLGAGTALINILTVIISFFSYDFITSSAATDMHAAVLLLTAVLFIIKIWDSERIKIAWGILAGLFLFLAAFFRFMYAPVVLLFIAGIVFLALIKKRKSVFSLLISFSTCALLITLMEIRAVNECGSLAYMIKTEKGFFPKNMKFWAPFVLAAFGNVTLAATQLQKITSYSFESWMIVFDYISKFSLMVLAYIAFLFVIKFFRKKNTPDRVSVFILSGTAISLLVIAEMIWLSLTNKQYETSSLKWTFIADMRYFAYPVVFLQQIFLVWLFKTDFSGSFKKIIAAVLLSFLMLEVAHEVYFTGKVFLNRKTVRLSDHKGKDYVYFENHLKSLIKNHPGKEILVASEDAYYTSLASLYNQKGIYDPINLNRGLPAVNKESVLLMVIPATKKINYESYIRQSGVIFLHEVSGYLFYQQFLSPQYAKDN